MRQAAQGQGPDAGDTPTGRKAYLLRQHALGRRIFGVFPACYPREILWAFNIVPAEIWDPPLEIRAADSHLQSYICAIVRQGLELVLQGKCDFLDGFLFPHTCDSIQNLASVVHDFLGDPKPCHFFYHPKAPYGKPARTFYREELLGLLRSLEARFGPHDPEALSQAVRKGRVIARLMAEFYTARSEGELDLSNAEFYRILRMGEYLHPDDAIPFFEGVLTRSTGQKNVTLPAVVLSGILPNPPELLSLLDVSGVRVGDDDLLCCGRRLFSRKGGESQGTSDTDPLETLVETYLRMPPCPTKGSPVAERRDHLFGLVEGCRARGVIFSCVKFCEPEWFDVPNLQNALKEKGIPSLVLDTEISRGLSGQMKTRVEAFLEMLG